MLKWIRGARLNFKTGLIIIVLALIAWAFITYMNIKTFVPEELRQEQPTP